MSVVYYKYPGDAFNNWKVIVKLVDGTYVGTVRVYSSGLLLDSVTTCFTDKDAEEWPVLSLEEAVRLTQ